MRLIDADKILLNDEIEYTETISGMDDEVEIRDFTAITLTEAVHGHIQALIQETPTVDAVLVKHGYWKKVKCDTILDKAVFSHALQCSECGKYKFKKELIIQKFYFCPNCGAKMDGGESK